MFQRQARSSFPIAYIVVAAAIVLGFIYFILKNSGDTTAAQQSSGAAEKADGLFPNEWTYAAREYPDFVPGAEAYAQAMRRAMLDATAGPQRGNKGFGAPWQVEGPYNIGARINTVKLHPSNPNIMYVGFSRGGVWKTTNGGAEWKPVFDGQSFLAISDIELDPKDPNVVYVGTGDLNIGSYVAIGDGLWKSTDGGQTWKHLGLENQRIISKIIIHPDNSNIIYAAAMGLPFQRNSDRGLYKTTDGGQTWNKILYVGEEAGVIDLVMATDNPNELYATSWDRIRTNTETFVHGKNCKIWKTTNGGQNWKMLEKGLPTGTQGRIGLANTKQQPNLLYAVFVDSLSELGGIYRSDDRGENWKALDSIPRTDWGGDVFGGFGWYFGKIVINPQNVNDLFIMGVELWRSKDAGATWYRAAPEWWEYEVHADLHDLAFAAPSVIVLATDGGLYRSLNNGDTWQDLENIPTTQFYRVAVNPHYPDYYYGGAQDNGTTGGNHLETEWPRLFGGDGFQAAFHPNDPGITYYETQNGSITCDFNGSWEDGDDGIQGDDRRYWDMPYFISRHDPEVMYTGTYRVYKSYGHPASWFPVSDDLTDGVVFEPRFHTITSVEESPVQADLIFVGTTDGNVWRGVADAQDWKNITAGLPDRYVSSVKGSPTDAKRIYATHTGYRDNDFTPHIHRSDDLGATWKSIQGDLPQMAINDLLILPGHQDSVIFVATEGGIYGTLDGGKRWERLGSKMPVVATYDLDVNPVTKRLVAGTHARSIMTFPLDSLRLNEDVSTDSPENERLALAVNPTLVSESVSISIKNLPTGQSVALSVADLSGKILKKEILKNGQQPTLQLDTRGFAPGTYVVFAASEGKVWAQRKFVVVR